MIVWLLVLIIAIIVEVITMGLTSIWFAGGALVAILVTLLHGPIWLQAIAFGIVSVLLLVFTRPIAVKYFNKDRTKTNVDSLIGKQGIVIEGIDNIRAAGTVTLNGQEWTARSYDERVRIPVGMVVEVQAVSGVKLIVKPSEEMRDVRYGAESNPEPLSVSEIENMEPLDKE